LLPCPPPTHAHPFPYTTLFRSDLVMGQMAPPDQHIHPVKGFIGQSVFRFVQDGGPDRKRRICTQMTGDRFMDALGVDARHMLVLAFVTILVPYGHPYRHHGTSPPAKPAASALFLFSIESDKLQRNVRKIPFLYNSDFSGIGRVQICWRSTRTWCRKSECWGSSPTTLPGFISEERRTNTSFTL